MKKKGYGIALILSLLFLMIAVFLIINKIININTIIADRYELRGVDVSHYQGNIDWKILEGQDLDFAVIKATEGSGYLDDCFRDNWQKAGETELYIGAYHFFSFDSEGKSQAEFYIDMVGDLEGKLAPFIDVEYYGDKKSNLPEKSEVTRNLGEMLEILEDRYQVKPVIYTTYTIYKDYIKGEFDDYPLWVRSVYFPPFFSFGGKWTFWQYTDTAILEGYEGGEKYIDMNVFRGKPALGGQALNAREEIGKLVVRCKEMDVLETFADHEE